MKKCELRQRPLFVSWVSCGFIARVRCELVYCELELVLHARVWLSSCVPVVEHRFWTSICRVHSQL